MPSMSTAQRRVPIRSAGEGDAATIPTPLPPVTLHVGRIRNNRYRRIEKTVAEGERKEEQMARYWSGTAPEWLPAELHPPILPVSGGDTPRVSVCPGSSTTRGICRHRTNGLNSMR